MPTMPTMPTMATTVGSQRQNGRQFAYDFCEKFPLVNYTT